MNAPFFTTGIHAGIPNEQYHADASISKSGLWTIYKQSPAHYRFGEREENPAFDFGTAVHTAVLEPDEFEKRTMRGPADRRGNNWKDAQAEAVNTGRQVLTAGDFDAVLTIRDALHANSFINSLIVSPHSQVEHSAFWRDEETGAHCRSRPDLYRADMGVMIDLKSTTSARPDAFARSVIDYGYHAQEAFYTSGHRANGATVAGFVFLAVEKTAPYAYAIYELPPSIVMEGEAIIRKALSTYQQCVEAETWPAYMGENGIQELKFKRWSYIETAAPDGEE